MISCADYRAYAERLIDEAGDGDDAARATAGRELEFARIYADHDRLLAERGALDFGDLIVRAFRLLHERPHVRERLSRRFRHVLVDEYQDTNFAQGMLLRLLVEEHQNVTVVGDDDQAIYRFRGASQKNLLDFRQEFPDAAVVRLERNYRSGRRILKAAHAVVEPLPARIDKRLTGRGGGSVRFWRCRSERAQAQAVAAEAERLVAKEGVRPSEIYVLVRSVKSEGQVIGSALEERAVPFRLVGSAAYFQRAEVRDVLAWLRLLADPNDSGAVVRALSRPPVELRSVDIARLTQLARRRKLDMPSAIAAALEGPQLSQEGRRAQAFLRLYRSASGAFDDRRPDAFVLRLIERIGLRRQQVFTHADTVERLRNIAKLSEIGTSYMQREPQATVRDFTRYLCAVAESGLREEEAALRRHARGPGDDDARRQGTRVRPRLRARPVRVADARRLRARGHDVPDELLKESLPEPRGREQHEAEMPALLHVATTGHVARSCSPGRRAPPWAPRRVRRRSTRRPAARSTPRRRSSTRSSSVPPRACTRCSASSATSCSTPWRAWEGGSAKCGSTPTSTSTRPWRATSSCSRSRR